MGIWKYLAVVLLLTGCDRGVSTQTLADGREVMQIRCYGEREGACEEEARKHCDNNYRYIDVQMPTEPEWHLDGFSLRDGLLMKPRHYFVLTFACE